MAKNELKNIEKPREAVRSILEKDGGLESMSRLARQCVGCELYAQATQTVWGEGEERAALVLVGEQPGDKEDLEGRPFVGPAGKLLRQSLETAGIPLKAVYLTNTVKHFRWVEAPGKPRLHKKPAQRHIKACLPWLEGQLELIRPEALVCLGATAAQALFGKDFRVTQQRGERVESPFAAYATATVHPSSLLRLRGSEERAQAREDFVSDLRRVREHLEEVGALLQ